MAGTISINRAPVLTLWEAVIAERLGFGRDTALTLGRALAGLNAYAKGVSLGLLEPSSKSVEHVEELGNRDDFVRLLCHLDLSTRRWRAAKAETMWIGALAFFFWPGIRPYERRGQCTPVAASLEYRDAFQTCPVSNNFHEAAELES